jgi:UDPglucose--hexose-1-phosphate uridylyltransferase
MSEFRRDPFTGHWRLFAEGRSARPNEYAGSGEARDERASCPFCEGREARTPPELAVVRPPSFPPNGTGWVVRSIPNRFPTLEPDAAETAPQSGPRFEARPGLGSHEVIVTSPSHVPAFAFLPSEQLRTVFRFFRDRVRAASAVPSARTAVLLENKGPESGGTLPHPHAQLLASSVVPDRVEEEVAALSGTGPCALETVVDHEREERERWIARTDEFDVFSPFASEHPFEVWIVPRRHRPTLADATDSEIDGLSAVLPAILRALESLRPGASYNWFVHGLVGSGPAHERFHWHVEVTPRLQRADGFELAAGIPVNAMLPEHAADAFRRSSEVESIPGRKR